MDLLGWLQDGGGRKRDAERFAALEKAADDLKRDFKVIRLEWEDVYDRLTRTMGRLNARIRKQESLEAPESDDGNPPKVGDHLHPQGTHAVLQRMRDRR